MCCWGSDCYSVIENAYVTRSEMWGDPNNQTKYAQISYFLKIKLTYHFSDLIFVYRICIYDPYIC